jgi:ribonuclease-3
MTTHSAKLAQLQQKLGYSFHDIKLLHQALTHRSADEMHNERLEFLGDAILSFVVADYLYHELTRIDEGQLSRMRAHLVKGETLAKVGRQLSLGGILNLGQGEQRSGGTERNSILSDAVEAIIAAVYLDGGLTAASDLIHRLLADLLRNPVAALQAKDPKSRLQEQLQAAGLPVPTYQIQQVQGSQHQQTFIVSCHISAHAINTTGQGTSRRKAEQQAATTALQQLQNL